MKPIIIALMLRGLVGIRSGVSVYKHAPTSVHDFISFLKEIKSCTDVGACFTSTRSMFLQIYRYIIFCRAGEFSDRRVRSYSYITSPGGELHFDLKFIPYH